MSFSVSQSLGTSVGPLAEVAAALGALDPPPLPPPHSRPTRNPTASPVTRAQIALDFIAVHRSTAGKELLAQGDAIEGGAADVLGGRRHRRARHVDDYIMVVGARDLGLGNLARRDEGRAATTGDEVGQVVR